MTSPSDCDHGAVISGRALAVVITPALLRRARVAHRGNPALYGELLTVSAVVLGAATGTQVAIRAAAAEAGFMTVTETSAAVGLKPRAIRRACAEGRLPAIKRGPLWFVDPAGLATRTLSC